MKIENKTDKFMKTQTENEQQNLKIKDKTSK